MAVDYVIVGAGSAGSVLADRLSADRSARVVLLEAGERDNKQAVHIPAAFSQLFGSSRDWNYRTVAQPALADRRIYWPRGKMLGGSSSLNAMMWVRGFAADYDRWAELAGPDWSFQSLVPYMVRAEQITGASRVDHGRAGAISIEPQRDPRSHTAAFLRAAREAGYPLAEANVPQPDGFTQTMVTQRRGARFSTVDAYLDEARTRSNLTIRTGVKAQRVLFRDGRAVAVQCLVDGEIKTISAAREVLICAGAVETPALLLRSGIGDGDALRALHIEPVVDAPEVGRNLADHLVAGLVAEAAGDTLMDARHPREVSAYLVRRRGMLSSNVAEAYGFVRTSPRLALPDIEILFAPVAYLSEGLVEPPFHGVTIAAILLQPESRGVVDLVSSDPSAPPRIDPGYLSSPGDRSTLLAGLEICQRIVRQPALARSLAGVDAAQPAPGVTFRVPEGAAGMSDREMAVAALEHHAHTLYHPVGTARMGTDPESVVDPQLRVRGVQGLRVVDASVIPQIIHGHTHAPTVFIAERAADLIKGAPA